MYADKHNMYYDVTQKLYKIRNYDSQKDFRKDNSCQYNVRT